MFERLKDLWKLFEPEPYNHPKYVLESRHNAVKSELREVKEAEEQRVAARKDLSLGCKLEIYRDSSKDWRWRLKAKNHKVIAISGEGYRRRAGLDKSLNLIKQIIEVVEEVEL